MKTKSWATAGNISRKADHQRKADLARQRSLEREELGRVPRGRLASVHDRDETDLPDEPPMGWARSGG